MIEYHVGQIVSSKAGHDKGKYFVIVKSEAEYVYLVDGVSRTLEKPKRKNKKHIQIVHYIDNNVSKKIINNEKITNDEIKRAIKLFLKQNH